MNTYSTPCSAIVMLFATVSVGEAALADPLKSDKRIHPVAALADHDAIGSRSSTVVPLGQLGAKAQFPYSGDGISVTPTPTGARLRAVFQKLEGEATDQGLWLLSTEQTPVGGKTERFRVIASGVGRPGGDLRLLPRQGKVMTQNQVARFCRSGMTEEYRVSMDGVRQDFVVPERPAGEGDLQVVLTVDGATAEPMTYGARLILNDSGRAIAYSRLQVSDGTGRELEARLEVRSKETLAVVVADQAAVYPIRIDPTFSDADWVSLGGFPGANDDVFALAIDDSGNLYAGGDFTAIGNVVANHVAKWDGSTWSALGSGTDDSVSALAVSGGNLYVGGYFSTAGGTPANNVAHWNGTGWFPLGSGVNNGVSCLLASGNNLYVGGYFSMAGGASANNIALWNGTGWSPLGSGVDNNVTDVYVSALAMWSDELYVGGSFTEAGGVPAVSIAKWNGTDWLALGAGLGIANSEPDVASIAIIGNDLYAAGRFSTPANNIARWNGTSWSSLGTGLNNTASALAAAGGNLYVGGGFTQAGGNPAQHIALWNGSGWAPVGTGMEDWVTAITISGNTVYVGGAFVQAGSVAANYIAKWEGGAWSALGSGGLNDTVQAITVSGTDLYVGGQFTSVPGTAANHVAQWDGSNWSPLGSGVDGTVRALVVRGDDVYVGGDFTMAGGHPANLVAKWNGVAWSPLGLGLSGASSFSPSVRALAATDAAIYAGGSFTNAGGLTANSIAKWDGTSWASLGTGMSNAGPFPFSLVAALAVSGTNLYVGGEFNTAGGVSANNIARWDGLFWSALGTGTVSAEEEGFAPVEALLISGDDLYAGGYFSEVDGVPANSIAKWNGMEWTPLGLGIDDFGEVKALAMINGDLYVGGRFDSTGGVAVNHVAKWDGTTWSALGSGLDRPVNALVAFGADLYAGGGFEFAGGKVSPYLALARVGSSGGPTVVYGEGEVTIYLQVPSAGQYEIRRCTDLAADIWETLGTVSGGENGVISYTDDAPPLPDAFYRALFVGP